MNKVTSTKTQIPYEYYDIPFCRPSKRRGEMENLGEVLAGDAITNSPYQVRTGRRSAMKRSSSSTAHHAALVCA